MHLLPRRLNADATWQLCLGGVPVVFDPWLVGPEVDVARWFHEAWHTGPVIPVDDVPDEALVVVSQPYSDHCHPPTLSRLTHVGTFAAVPSAVRAVRRARPDATVHPIPAWGRPPLAVGDVRLWRLSSPWWRPPVYHAVVVADPRDHAIVHAPHGLDASDGAALRASLHVLGVAVSRSRYTLPRLLGGRVGPGWEAADALVDALQPTWALAVHDEPKHETGLVARLARAEAAPAAGAPWIDGRATTDLDSA